MNNDRQKHCLCCEYLSNPGVRSTGEPAKNEVVLNYSYMANKLKWAFVKTCSSRCVLHTLLIFAAGIYSLLGSATEISNTGVLGRRAAYWINNHQVLFPGIDADRPVVGTNSRSYRSALFIWDEGTRKVTVYADIPDGDYVCFSDGYISYAVRKDGERYIREGRIGAEIERKWRTSAVRRMIDRNHVTCKDFDYSTAGQIYPGYFFIPLRDGDGYYGWSKPQRHADNSHSAMFYLPFGQGKKPVQLPFSSEKLGRVSYSQFLDAYVFEYVPSRRNEETVGKVWILSTSGDVTESTIPAGKWMRGSLTFVPARNGVIMSSTAAGFTSAEDPGHAGIYLVREDKVERLLSGFPGVPAVSPNGCKVAVVVDPMTGPAPRATLQIVRLCDGGRNNGH